jgi:hypothetical protein
MKKYLLLFCFTFLALTGFSQSKTNSDPIGFFQGTFASTDGFLWVKITVKGRNVTAWMTSSSSGDWGTPQTCIIDTPYMGRNSDGSKYYSTYTSGCSGEQKFLRELAINYWPSGGSNKYSYQFGASGKILYKVKPTYYPWD